MSKTLNSSLMSLADECHSIAREKGWWPSVRAEDVPKLLMLCVTELAEAMEEFRKGNSLYLIYLQGDKPEGFPIEVADCLIRILDLSAAFGIPLDSAIEMKMEYNKTRPHRHGGKIA